MPDDRPLNRQNLLWEPESVVHFLARDTAYERLRRRSQHGIATLSAQIYAEVAARLHQRAPSPTTLALHLEELDDFRIVPLDRDVAELYASVYRLCLANARNRGLIEPEIGFV